MAEYYLVSQLPSLDGLGDNMPLPITEERFLDLCHRFLSEKAQIELSKLSLMPSRTHEKSSSALIDAWNEGERNLRLILGKVRADKMKKTFDSDNAESKAWSAPLLLSAMLPVESTPAGTPFHHGYLPCPLQKTSLLFHRAPRPHKGSRCYAADACC